MTADYAPPLRDLVDRVLALRAGVDAGRPVLVGRHRRAGGREVDADGIPRGGAAGAGASAVLVPMDGFHLANVALAASAGPTARAPSTRSTAPATPRCSPGCARPADTVWAPTYDRSIEESVANAIAVPAGTDSSSPRATTCFDDGPWSAVRGLLDEAWAVEVDPDCAGSAWWPGTSSSASRRMPRGPGSTRSTSPNADFVRATFGRADLVIRCP